MADPKEIFYSNQNRGQAVVLRDPQKYLDIIGRDKAIAARNKAAEAKAKQQKEKDDNALLAKLYDTKYGEFWDVDAKQLQQQRDNVVNLAAQKLSQGASARDLMVDPEWRQAKNQAEMAHITSKQQGDKAKELLTAVNTDKEGIFDKEEITGILKNFATATPEERANFDLSFNKYANLGEAANKVAASLEPETVKAYAFLGGDGNFYSGYRDEVTDAKIKEGIKQFRSYNNLIEPTLQRKYERLPDTEKAKFQDYEDFANQTAFEMMKGAKKVVERKNISSAGDASERKKEEDAATLFVQKVGGLTKGTGYSYNPAVPFKGENGQPMMENLEYKGTPLGKNAATGGDVVIQGLYYDPTNGKSYMKRSDTQNLVEFNGDNALSLMEVAGKRIGISDANINYALRKNNMVRDEQGRLQFNADPKLEQEREQRRQVAQAQAQLVSQKTTQLDSAIDKKDINAINNDIFKDVTIEVPDKGVLKNPKVKKTTGWFDWATGATFDLYDGDEKVKSDLTIEEMKELIPSIRAKSYNVAAPKQEPKKSTTPAKPVVLEKGALDDL